VVQHQAVVLGHFHLPLALLIWWRKNRQTCVNVDIRPAPSVTHEITKIATHPGDPVQNWVSGAGRGYRRVTLLTIKQRWRNSPWHFCGERAMCSDWAIQLVRQKQHYHSQNYFLILYRASFTVDSFESGRGLPA